MDGRLMGFVLEQSGQLTRPLHDVINGSVINGGIAGLDIHKRLASYPHRHHFLHAQLCS